MHSAPRLPRHHLPTEQRCGLGCHRAVGVAFLWGAALFVGGLVAVGFRPPVTGVAWAGATETGAAQGEAVVAGDPTPAVIAGLIAGLGDSDFQRRESAAAALKAIGPAAVDALLAAAELDDDLEVALRARWLADAIPLEMPHDISEVARLLESYKQRDFRLRVRVLQRLLRVDDNAGIEALARVVRLDRTVIGSREAAALLVGEWRPDDPWWPEMATRASVGLGTSARPTAAFVRGVIAFSQATDQQARDAALQASGAALALLDRVAADESQPIQQGDGGDEELEDEAGSATTARPFQRCQIRMLLAAGKRDEALAVASQLLEASWTGQAGSNAVMATVDWLVWGVEVGLSEIVDRLHTARPDLVAGEPLVGFAAALAERSRGNADRAATLADKAFAGLRVAVPGRRGSERMQAAVLLARWGCPDWAMRVYTAVVDDATAVPIEFVLTATFGAEYLHEMERDDEATAFLGRLLDKDRARKDVDAEQTLSQIGRDYRATLARLRFFASSAAAARGDSAGCRAALEDALRSSSKDVDSLIALYRLPDNTPDQQADALRRVNEALRQIDNEIQALDHGANDYNEYAWLVANTQGDAEKATRYSKQSLAFVFDSSSYLDTLAHCRAAAGDLAGAIRWQSLARRHEPHNETIRKNLLRFQEMAAKATPTP